jgi:hypothetical protein
MLGNKIKPMKSGMVGQRINLDPTESLNNAMSPAQAQGPRLFDPGVAINNAMRSGQPVGTTGMLSGPAQPMRQAQGPALFDPTVAINNAMRSGQPVGSVVSGSGGVISGNAQPVRMKQIPNSMTIEGALRRNPRSIGSRAMGRGAGAFGMRGRSLVKPMPGIAMRGRGLVKPMPKARGRGRGRRR